MVDILDGDTIRVDLDGRTVTVRLLGIDTPEKLGGPRPAECFGTEATAFAAALLPIGSAVELYRDQAGRDQYGRTLAWVLRPDGVFANLALVESGHASALFFPPNDALEPLFVDAAHHARREWIGFWPSCGAADVTLNSG